MRLLLIGDDVGMEPLASVLRAEGMSAHCVPHESLPPDLAAYLNTFSAVLIEEGESAPHALDIVRARSTRTPRVLIASNGGIREGQPHDCELLFPRAWTRQEARILCAWLRSNQRSRADRRDERDEQ